MGSVSTFLGEGRRAGCSRARELDCLSDGRRPMHARARVHRHGGVVAILSDIPFDWFNQVLIEGADATPAGLHAVVEKGLGHAGGFVVRLRDGVDDRFIETLNRIGLIAASEATTTPGMVAFPIDRDAVAGAVAPSRLPRSRSQGHRCRWHR